MDWAGKQHPVETLAEWVAPALVAGAFGWSATSIGLAQANVALVAVAVYATCLLVVRNVGRPRLTVFPAFEPVAFDATDAAMEELLLDNPLVEPGVEGELLLDDPLTEIPESARVVRLFARQEPTPGELVARIEDFLGDGARRATAVPEVAQVIPDAGAALHAALANVRASLR